MGSLSYLLGLLGGGAVERLTLAVRWRSETDEYISPLVSHRLASRDIAGFLKGEVMYTMFECRSCGFVWDCEGTPYGDCPKCGGEGMMLHQNGTDYCWQCGEPEGVCQCWGEEETEKPANQT